jgi:hypothetical protein
MSLFLLKLIAIVTMTADHTGNFFFPHAVEWKIIGRLAFPIFAWGIANGYAHTRDAYGYLSRLFLFAIISQIPFSLGYLYLGFDPTILNIFFTLSLGLLAIIKFRESSSWVIGSIWVLLIAALGSVFQVDYGAYGILMIFFFHLTFRKVLATIALQVLLYACIQFAVFWLLNTVEWVDMLLIHPIQVFSLISLYPILLYNGEKGKSFSRLFYWFYPVHLAVLLILAVVVR